ncbi:TPA: hypothetical protein ACRRXZ_001517 [Morganella morganii]
MSYSEIEKENVICHELGHWLVAKSVGFDVGDISIEFINEPGFKSGHEANALYFPSPSLKTLDDVKEYLIDRGAAASAGVACQHLLFNCEKNATFSEYAEGDLMKVMEHSITFRGIVYPNETGLSFETKQRNEYYQITWSKAVEILKEQLNTLKIVVSKMQQITKEDNKKYLFTKSEIENLFDELANK